MKKPDKAPTDLDEERRAELREMEAAVARGGPLPTWAEIVIASTMRESFSPPYDDDPGGPEAA